MPLLELLRIGSKRVFDQNIWAMLTLKRNGLPHSNQELFTAKLVRGQVVCTFRVLPPTSSCPTLHGTLPCQIAMMS